MKNYILLGMAVLFANLSLAQNGRSSAEVFIQVEDRGSFTVYLNQEFIGSNTGNFRFYDVYSTAATLSIVQGNRKVYSGQINFRQNERTIFNYSIRQGLRTIRALKIYRNGQYVLNDFEGETGTYTTGTTNQVNPFDNLLVRVTAAPFDDDKSKVILTYAANNRLSTAEIATLLKVFFKDENKLMLVKSIIRSVSDPQNYYLLKDSFTFISGKEEFMTYLNGRSSTQNTLLTNRDFEQLLANVKKEPFDDGKTKVIQAAIPNGSPSTAQIAELLKTYSFDDNTLATAKLLYVSVSDPQRYYTLKEIFKFISNREAFLDFLGRQ